MATSSAMSTTNDKIKYTISIAQNSQSVTNNTSNVTVSVRVYRTNTGYTTYGTGTVYCTINGTQYTASITSDDKITSSGIVLFTRTLNITHNADGTKTLATSARITHDQFSSSSQSYSQTLTTIPRATTPTLSASSVDMGASITVNMPRASSSFDHTLTYKFGDTTGTIGSELGTSKAWTVPLSLASQVPNGTSGTCTITCKTYSGSTLIGTKTVSFTAKVPSSVVPSISTIGLSEAVAGINAQFKGYVQNKSKLAVSITAGGSYSSTIKAYKTVILGKTYTTASFTSGILTSSGSVSIAVTVTDSRGRTATKTSTVTVIVYSPPAISTFSVFRANGLGTADPEGTMINARIKFAVATVNNLNTKSYKVEYKLKTNTTWTQATTGSVYTYDSTMLLNANLSSDSTYDVRITVTDFFGSAVALGEIPTAFTLIDFNTTGKALAFGKVSEKTEGLEIALPTYFGHAETPSSATFLTSGQDLNNLLEPGFYVIPNTTISGTLLNKPWTSTATGGVTVLQEGDGMGKCQIAHKLSKDDSGIYERSYYQSAWGDWQAISTGAGRLLWNGTYYMTAGHIITFSELASKQANGIVLVFSEYYDGEAKNQTFNSHFVHKKAINLQSGTGHSFFMLTSNGAYCATKYLYIRDDGITGHANNNLVITATSGITLTNNRFVLRYVIGV